MQMPGILGSRMMEVSGGPSADDARLPKRTPAQPPSDKYVAKSRRLSNDGISRLLITRPSLSLRNHCYLKATCGVIFFERVSQTDNVPCPPRQHQYDGDRSSWRRAAEQTP